MEHQGLLLSSQNLPQIPIVRPLYAIRGLVICYHEINFNKILLSLPKLPFHVPLYTSASVTLTSHSFLSYMHFIDSTVLKIFDEEKGPWG